MLEDSWNLFLSGRVHAVCLFGATTGSTGIILVTMKVEASQTFGGYHQPWAMVKKEGTVLSVHSTCMAE